MNTPLDLLVREAYMAHPTVVARHNADVDPGWIATHTRAEYDTYIRAVAFMLGGTYSLDVRDRDSRGAWAELLAAVRRAFDEAAEWHGRASLALIHLVFALQRIGEGETVTVTVVDQ